MSISTHTEHDVYVFLCGGHETRTPQDDSNARRKCLVNQDRRIAGHGSTERRAAAIIS